MTDLSDTTTLSDMARTMGAKGGKARLKTMSAKQRARSASNAAKARWKAAKKKHK